MTAPAAPPTTPAPATTTGSSAASPTSGKIPGTGKTNTNSSTQTGSNSQQTPSGSNNNGQTTQTHVGKTTKGPVAVGGNCIYWLHTHAPDGVIHVESPTRRVYTLGNFFDEWGQRLSSTAVADASGKVAPFLNGKPWTKDPRSIPLLPHAVIQLSVGSPIAPFQSTSWAGTLL